MHTLRLLVLSLVVLFSGCEGPIGPPGPEGPPGASVAIQSQMIRIEMDGGALLTFRGTQIEDVVVNCWVGDSPSGPWYGVATDINNGITCVATNRERDLLVVLLGGPPRWWFLVTLVSS